MEILDALPSCALFRGIARPRLEALLQPAAVRVRSYEKDQLIALEDEACNAVGIVLSGSIRVQKIYASGKLITIDTLGIGNSFGEAIIFSDQHTYPATLQAAEDAGVAYLSREQVTRLCADSPDFLNNFMRLLSNKILMLNRKIKGLSYQTLRQKVVHFILEESRRQASQVIALPGSKNAIADTLGVPRPSLSRELIAMRDDGLIDFDRKTIQVLDAGRLACCVGDFEA